MTSAISGLAYYQVERNGVLLPDQVPTNSFNDTTVLAGSHSYRVRAVDVSGNVGDWSTPLTISNLLPWPVGTISARRLKEEVQAHLESAIQASSLKERGHVTFGIDKDPKTSGVRIVILSGADEERPWEYAQGNQRVLEENQKLTVGIVADETGGAKRSGGASGRVPFDEAVFSILRAALTDRSALNARGLFNARETAEGLEIEGLEFRRRINLNLHTDTYLD